MQIHHLATQPPTFPKNEPRATRSVITAVRRIAADAPRWQLRDPDDAWHRAGSEGAGDYPRDAERREADAAAYSR